MKYFLILTQLLVTACTIDQDIDDRRCEFASQSYAVPVGDAAVGGLALFSDGSITARIAKNGLAKINIEGEIEWRIDTVAPLISEPVAFNGDSTLLTTDDGVAIVAADGVVSLEAFDSQSAQTAHASPMRPLLSKENEILVSLYRNESHLWRPGFGFSQTPRLFGGPLSIDSSGLVVGHLSTCEQDNCFQSLVQFVQSRGEEISPLGQLTPLSSFDNAQLVLSEKNGEYAATTGGIFFQAGDSEDSFAAMSAIALGLMQNAGLSQSQIADFQAQSSVAQGQIESGQATFSHLMGLVRISEGTNQSSFFDFAWERPDENIDFFELNIGSTPTLDDSGNVYFLVEHLAFKGFANILGSLGTGFDVESLTRGFDPSGRYLFAFNKDGLLWRTQLETSPTESVQPQANFSQSGPPPAPILSRDGHLLVASGSSVSEIDANNGEVLKSFELGNPVVGEIQTDASYLYLSTADGVVHRLNHCSEIAGSNL